MGNFASKANNGLYADNLQNPAGWAKPGPALQLSVNYRVAKSFGLSFLVSGQENKQDAAAFESGLKKLFNTGDNFVVKTNSWKILRAMVGGYYNIPLFADKFTLQPKLFFGVLKTSIPAHQFYDTTSFSWSGNTGEASLPFSFCYELAADFQWNLSGSLYIKADLNFFHSSPKGYDIPINSVNFHSDTTIPVSSINGLAGIGMRF